MATRNGEEVALGLVIIGTGAIFLYAGFQIENARGLVGPRSLPLLTSGLIALGGLTIVIRGLFGLSDGKADAEHKLFGIVLPSVALALVFLWLWGALGWTLASLIAAPVFFAVFGARGWKELVLYPASIVAVLYLIFYQFLGLWHGTGWLIERLGL